MRTIVISAVNIRKGGTLTILRSCLEYLSVLAQEGQFRIVALVHKRELCYYQGIEYIEIPDTVKSWGRRLWCEYVTMHRISKSLSPIYLWLSLHDTTPRVVAERQAVYCQTSFPFMHCRLKDLRFDYKIVLFSLFTRFAYRANVQKNKYLIVQTEWLRKGLSGMLHLPENRFIVAPPQKEQIRTTCQPRPANHVYTFLYAATPDCHKNFELLCRASQLLEKELGSGKFRVIFTISGTENKYSHHIYRKWGKVSSLEFAGFMKRDDLYECYAQADCLVFPSRIETWGLPISEFMAFGKPMLLANLPYAHETAAGSSQTAFFNSQDPNELKSQMKLLISGKCNFLKEITVSKVNEPKANSWKDLFALLLK